MAAIIVSVLTLALRISLPGVLWTTGRDGDSRGVRMGRQLLLGLLLNLAPALALAGIGIWTVSADWLAWGGMVGAGLYRHVRRQGRGIRSIATGLGIPFAVTAAAILIPMILPVRSEWMAGGWDPGLYQNNAIAIANRNGWRAKTDSIYTALSIEQRRALSDSAEAPYHEIMPAVPIRLRDGSLPLYFPPLTPVCGAWLYRIGGIGMLNRMGGILAMLGMLGLAALAERLGLSRAAARLAAGWLLLSPLWWYHQAVPTAEGLQICILYGGLLFYLDAMREGQRVPVAAMVFLFAAPLNHFSALVYAAGFLIVAAIAEGLTGRPERGPRLACAFSALAAGGCAGLHLGWITFFRLQEKDAALSAVSGAVWLAVLLSVTAASPAGRRVIRAFRWNGVRPVLLTALGMLAMITITLAAAPMRLWLPAATATVPVIGGFLHHYSRLLTFHGAGGILLALAGCALLWRDRRPNPHASPAGVVVFCLGAITLLLLTAPGIMPIYPWALRRYAVTALPLLALAQGIATAGVLTRKQAAVPRVALGLLVGLVLIEGLRQSRRASRVGDYAGLTAVLDTLNTHLQEGDVVICDDARWGTPLLLVHNRDVINGNRIPPTGDPARQALLERIRARHDGRLLLFTSRADEPQAPEAHPGEYRTPIMAPIPFTYQTVIHGTHERHYRMETRRALFRLDEWMIAPASPLVNPRPGPHRLLTDRRDTLEGLRWGRRSLDRQESADDGRWRIIALPDPPEGAPAMLEWSGGDAGQAPPQDILLAAGDPLDLACRQGCLYPAAARTPSDSDTSSPKPFPLPFVPGAERLRIHLQADPPPQMPLPVAITLNGQTPQQTLTLKRRQASPATRVIPAANATHLKVSTPTWAGHHRLRIRVEPLYREIGVTPVETGLYGFDVYSADGVPDGRMVRRLEAGQHRRIRARGNRLLGACRGRITGPAPYQSDLEPGILLDFEHFHPREYTGDPRNPYQRWTRAPEARIRVAVPERTGLELHIRLRDARPPSPTAPPPVLKLAGHTYPVRFDNALWDATIPIAPDAGDADAGDTAVLYIHGDTWTPATVMDSGDTRTLGVLLEHLSVTVSPSSAPP